MQCILLYYNLSRIVVTILIKHNVFAKFYKRYSIFAHSSTFTVFKGASNL